jgi:hypothetical protein
VVRTGHDFDSVASRCKRNPFKVPLKSVDATTCHPSLPQALRASICSSTLPWESNQKWANSNRTVIRPG